MASFRKLNTGWEYRISYKENGKYKEKSKRGFKTKKEAQVAAAGLESRLNKGVDFNAGDMPFPEYYKEWYETYKKGKFSPETDLVYQTAVNLVEKHFGDYRLKQITKKTYQQFLNTYAEGRSKASVRKMHNKIGSCLREAFRNGDIAMDVTFKAHIGGREERKEEEKYLHEEEAKRLLSALKDGLRLDYISRYMAILQLATGARVGEIMALTFDCVDFKKNAIKIEKSWDYNQKTGFKPTKGKETRFVSVDQKTMTLIQPLYDHVRKRSLAGLFENKHNLVFVDEFMEPVAPYGVNKMLERACKRADIPRATSHTLRHTHASILLLHGVDLQYVSERLGHSDMTTTAQVYSHVLKEARQKGDTKTSIITSSLYA